MPGRGEQNCCTCLKSCLAWSSVGLMHACQNTSDYVTSKPKLCDDLNADVKRELHLRRRLALYIDRAPSQSKCNQTFQFPVSQPALPYLSRFKSPERQLITDHFPGEIPSSRIVTGWEKLLAVILIQPTIWSNGSFANVNKPTLFSPKLIQKLWFIFKNLIRIRKIQVFERWYSRLLLLRPAHIYWDSYNDAQVHTSLPVET